MKWNFCSHSASILVGKQEEPTTSISYDDEVSILNSFIDSYLSEYKDNLQIVSNTDDYTTLKYNDMDLIRLKYSDNTKWITIFIPPKYKNEYIENELFITQKNKNQLHWKSVITNKNDLSKYVDICIRDIEFWQ